MRNGSVIHTQTGDRPRKAGAKRNVVTARNAAVSSAVTPLVPATLVAATMPRVSTMNEILAEPAVPSATSPRG